MRTNNTHEQTVAIHTLVGTTPEKLDSFTDHGRLVEDLGREGLHLAMTTRDTFDNDQAHAVDINEQGVPVCTEITIRPGDISAMHVPVTRENPIAGRAAYVALARSLKALVTDTNREVA